MKPQICGECGARLEAAAQPPNHNPTMTGKPKKSFGDTDLGGQLGCAILIVAIGLFFYLINK